MSGTRWAASGERIQRGTCQDETSARPLAHRDFEEFLADRPWLRREAQRFGRRRGDYSWEDIYQDGLVRAWQAFTRHDSERSSAGTWALLHFRGGVVDGLRRMRQPWEGGRNRSQQHRSSVSLDRPLMVGEDEDTVGDQMEDRNATASAERAEARRIIERLARRLPQPMARVIALRLADLALAEVGEMIGLKESRVCQLERAAVQRMRAAVRREAA